MPFQPVPIGLIVSFEQMNIEANDRSFDLRSYADTGWPCRRMFSILEFSMCPERYFPDFSQCAALAA